MFDFCFSVQHLPKEKHSNCPAKFQRWYVGPVGRGRNKNPNGIIYLDEHVECSCWCHKDGGKPPAKKKAAKKTATKTTKRKS